ncbi:MAG: class I SAM-dependent methyltransferase [Deltaproteobacteria bacterium]|nr:class I SAM-dependent methyltransferase [Deltaproteobacteria bacterium]
MGNEPDQLATVLANRVRKNAKHLAKWAKREAITCYRVYDRDIPEIPITIDTYGGSLVINDFRASDRGGGDPWLDAMVGGAKLALEPPEVFVKQRERLVDRREGHQYGRMVEVGAWRTVTEGGHKFRVNLSDYIDTGLFLDHRTTRRLVAAEGKRTMLNLFAYTGAFSVYCAAAGMHTTTVDLSNTYTEWAKENLALNGLTGDIVQADVREYLTDARKAGITWDLIVADVPTFSNSKRMDYTWDVQRDHVQFLEDLLGLISPEGVIWFATNSRRFKMELAPTGPLDVTEMTKKTLPPDFRDQKIHKSFRIAPRGDDDGEPGAPPDDDDDDDDDLYV